MGQQGLGNELNDYFTSHMLKMMLSFKFFYHFTFSKCWFLLFIYGTNQLTMGIFTFSTQKQKIVLTVCLEMRRFFCYKNNYFTIKGELFPFLTAAQNLTAADENKLAYNWKYGPAISQYFNEGLPVLIFTRAYKKVGAF